MNLMSPAVKSRCNRRAVIVKALAHPSRLAIADALQHGERCVAYLTDLVGADISTVSKHLSVMKSAGLLAVDKRGLNMFYRLACRNLRVFLNAVDALVPHDDRAPK